MILREIVNNSISLSQEDRKKIQKELNEDSALGSLINCNLLSKFLIGRYEINKEKNGNSLYKNLYNGYEITTMINDNSGNFASRNYTVYICMGYAPNYYLGYRPCNSSDFIDGIKYIKIKHVNHRNLWWKMVIVNVTILYLHFLSFLFVTLHLDNEEFMRKFSRFDTKVYRFIDRFTDDMHDKLANLKTKNIINKGIKNYEG